MAYAVVGYQTLHFYLTAQKYSNKMYSCAVLKAVMVWEQC